VMIGVVLSAPLLSRLAKFEVDRGVARTLLVWAGAGLVADIVLKIGVYFIHERIWDRINYGREAKAPEYEI